MFGYVNVNRGDLTGNEIERYHSFYCGLCRALNKRYGRAGQMTLSYDMAFLAMLLSSLYESQEESGKESCLLHPAKKHGYVANEYLDYCADMTIALSYYNLLDNWEDDHSLPSLTAAKALQKKHLAVAKLYPIQCCAIHHKLGQLAQMERNNSHNLDEVSSCFGELLAEIFDCKHDMWSTTLREMGFALGKFIYIMDAYEDLDKDIRKCRYNLLLGIAGKPGYEEQCHEILTTLMAQCAEAFEKLPCLQDTGILRNVIYSGVWSRYYSLQKKPAAKKDGDNAAPNAPAPPAEPEPAAPAASADHDSQQGRNEPE